MKKIKASGFSLIELLIVITISSALILFMAQLYRMVGRTADTIFSVNNDWLFERFVRKQFWFMDRRFVANDWLKGSEIKFSFVSQYSAQYGMFGPLVRVQYQYDESAHQLAYSETAVAAWWDESKKNSSKLDLRATNNQRHWRSVVLSKITQFKLSYFDGKQWSHKWYLPNKAPLLVKVNFSRAGEVVEIILETRVLSYSMPSGF